MTEKNYVVNVKTKAGTIFTVRADTSAELINNIEGLALTNIDTYLGALEELILGVSVGTQSPAVAAVTAIGGTVISETPVAGGFAPVPPPAVQPVSAGVGEKTCAHGVMVKRTGESQYGLWKAWMCPTPKGTPDQCKPVYAKKGSPEFTSF